jgi:hypothetical protein
MGDFPMKTTLLCAAIFVLTLANAAGQAKVLTNDPLTGLPLTPATVVKNAGNEPVKMPDGHVCKSKMQGNFYFLYNYFSKHNVKVSQVVARYSSHLSGFNKVVGYDGSSQTAFYNSDRTIVIIVTGNQGAKGEDTDAYAVAYERYQPGISEATIASLTQGKITCP